MTAPDRTTWTVADDPNGCPTIWDEQHEAVATLDNVILLGPYYRDLVWSVLKRVLAPDEATVERLAEAVHSTCYDHVAGFSAHMLADRRAAKAVLAALADTSAQARHTDDDATGVGEHG